MVRKVRFGALVMLLVLFSVSAMWAEGESGKTKFAPINTAVPSLSIAPDARGGAMGDNGLATLPDVNSQYWNAAKYAFMYSKAGVSLSYTPWLRKLVNDVALANLSGYYKIGDSDLQAIGASLRYFSLGAGLVSPLSAGREMPYRTARIRMRITEQAAMNCVGAAGRSRYIQR